MKEFLKKKPVKIVLIILAVLLVVGIVLGIVFANKAKEQISNFTYTRTITLSKGSLEDTVVSSGTIESQTTSTITSSVNASISKINYAVGDYVEEGDVIIELDASNLNKQISKQKEKVNEQEDQLQDKYDSAYDNYDSASSSYKSALASYNSANSAYTSAKNSIKDLQDEYDKAESKRAALAEKYYSDKETTDALDDYQDEEGKKYSELKEAVEKAKETLDIAKANVNYDTLEKNYNSAKESFTKAESTYKQNKTSFEDAESSLNKGADKDSLNDLYDTVADYKLKAKTSGQITNINAILGSNASGTLVTIQDTSKLKIALTIDEYDILKIELGMKARVETDASNIVYDGVVSQISPVASTGSMGSSGGFEIEVQITSEDVSKLLIGMNAEVTIIIDSGDSNYNVPIDAIEDKEDGTSVIYVKNSEGEFEEVEVTKGKQNGYYIEIFGDSLYDGMQVRASANVEEAEVNSDNIEDAMQESGFDFGGSMPNFQGGGGSMPSGGSMPNFQGGGGSMPSGGIPSGSPGGR